MKLNIFEILSDETMNEMVIDELKKDPNFSVKLLALVNAQREAPLTRLQFIVSVVQIIGWKPQQANAVADVIGVPPFDEEERALIQVNMAALKVERLLGGM